MAHIIKNNRFFIFPYILFLIGAIILLLIIPKAEIHIYINKLNNEFFDQFFKHITFLGDGIFIIAITVLLLFKKISYAVCNLSIYLGSGILVQLFKRIILPDAPRPKNFFEGIYNLHFVEGITIHGAHSFPSGHTASAFGLFIFLALISKNDSVKILCFFLAILVAYSRLYLSQHFLIDVVFGSFIGVTSGMVIYMYFKRIKNERFNQPVYFKK